MATEVGTAYVTLMPKMDGFSSKVNAGLSSINTSSVGASWGNAAGTSMAGKVTSKLSSMFKGGGVLAIGAKAVSTAMNAVSSSINSAISRVDTMANFSSVMSSLGFSADEASEKVQQISSHLDGLPTSLDGAVSMVQQLTATTGDMGKATNLALAFNDAMLAGGQGTEKAASAFNQFNRILSTGTVEADSWQSLVSAAPAQMQQLSEALLGAGANQSDLQSALKKGTVSLEDFEQAFIDLDEQGGESFSSFKDQAIAGTQGIQTAIENVQNRINKAVASIIDEIGSSNIAGAINSVSSQFGNMAKPVVSFIQGLKESFSNLGLSSIISTLKTDIEGILPSFDDVLNSSKNFGNGVGEVFTQLMRYFQNSHIIENFGNACSSVFDALKQIGETIGNVFGVDKQGLLSTMAKLAFDVSNAFRDIADFASNVAAPLSELAGKDAGALQAVWGAFQPVLQSLPSLEEMKNTVSDLFGSIQEVAGNFYDAITECFSSEWMSDAMQNLSTGISDVMTAAEPFVNNILIPLANIVLPAIANITSSVVAMLANLAGAILQLAAKVMNFVSGLPETISNAINSILTYIVTELAGLMSSAGETGNFISAIFSAACSAVSNAFNGVVSFVSGVPGSIAGFFGGIGDTITGLFNSAVSGVQGVFNGIVDFVSSIPDKIVGFFSGIGSSITQAIGSISFPTPHITDGIEVLGVTLPTIEWYANGGYMSGTTLIGAGEAGGEGIVPLEGSHMQPFAEAVADYLGEGGLASWLASNLPGIIAENAPNLVIDNDAGRLIVDNRLYQLQRKAAMNRG